MNKTSAATLGLDVAAIDAQMAANWSLPAHTYVDPAIYEFELDQVFSGSWQYIAPLEKVANPGDVVIGQIGRTPVVVTRDDEGRLAGFVNVCRHRGYCVVTEDRTNCKRLQCGYHAWTYGLDGSLLRAPGTEQDPTVKPEELGLPPISVDAWAQGIFVNSNPDAGGILDAHPLLNDVADKRGLDRDPASYRLRRSIVIEQAANWKLWYDNGVECYHCNHIHGESFAAAYNVPGGSFEWDTFGSFSNAHFEPSPPNGDELRSSTYCSIQVFPGVQIVQQDDFMVMGQVVPTGPESSLFVAHYLADVDSPAERVDQWLDLWSQTYQEDAEAIAVQQRNLRAGAVERMKYVSNREGPVLFFNGLIWDAYKAGLCS